MKRVTIFVLICVTSLFAKYKSDAVKPHTANTTTPENAGSLSSSVFYITSTGVDTSGLNQFVGEYITYGIALDDTSTANESASSKVVFYQCSGKSLPSAFSECARDDSLTVTDQTKTFHIYAHPASKDNPTLDWHYVTLTGQAANKKLSAVSATITVDYVEARRK